MHCKYCGFANGEDDHRCLRCGRRTGFAVAAPAGYSGANALSLAPLQANDTQEFEPAATQQPALFNAMGQKVIPFDQIQRHVTGRLNVQPAPPPPAPSLAQGPPRPHAKKSASARFGAAPEQASLDFVPAAPAAQRTLKTDVPAQIYCEQPVATPTHRFIASSMDAAMILLGFGLFAAVGEMTGGAFGSGRLFWIMLAASLALISMFYGLIWAIAGRETAGMHWTDLHLITFDGFPVDGRSRASRVASTWLSFCSGGLGLLWAVADEENLTWHDHISKTFPTIREVPQSFVRQRKR
ncbi:MAG: RDD family protein [Bryobacteraceae bacterium]|jgi:uncharacterized RDD family membrane protein YckC